MVKCFSLTESFFHGFGGPKSSITSINLPPPSIPAGLQQTSSAWATPPQQSVMNALPPHRDIAVLGADIIAETFGDLLKKAKISSLPPSPLQNKPLISPQGKVMMTPEDTNRPLDSQVSNEAPPFPPPPPFHHNQSPFSWQRSEYARERRPSYDDEHQFRQDFPPQNPYIYRKPDTDTPPPQQQDPRLAGGDPRKAARGHPPSGPGPGHPRRFPGGPPGDEFHHRGPPQMDPRY